MEGARRLLALTAAGCLCLLAWSPPAQAQGRSWGPLSGGVNGWFPGSNGNGGFFGRHLGWGNGIGNGLGYGGRCGGGGWMHHHHHFNNGMGFGGGSSYLGNGGAYGYNNGLGWGGGGRWGGGLFGQGTRITQRENRIQQLLNSGNLSPAQQTQLQSRLAQLQARQGALNGQLSSRLSNQQSYLQNLLSSGNLSPMQQSNIQNRLTQESVAATTPLKVAHARAKMVAG